MIYLTLDQSTSVAWHMKVCICYLLFYLINVLFPSMKKHLGSCLALLYILNKSGGVVSSFVGGNGDVQTFFFLILNEVKTPLVQRIFNVCIHFAFSSLPKEKCLSLQMIGNSIQLVSMREVLLSLKHILVKMMMSSPFHLL